MRALSGVGAVAARPSLGPAAVRQAGRMAPTRWLTRWPFLPVPASSYMRFRLVTQYGDPDHPARGEDVVRYLRWCRQWRAVRS